MNYGAIGLVIGHEIIHGFDETGRKFDKEGNVADWWVPPTEEKFMERIKCIIRQYSNYTDSHSMLHVSYCLDRFEKYLLSTRV